MPQLLAFKDNNIGIGLSNPTRKLDVFGDISASGVIEVGKDSDTRHILGKAAIGNMGFAGDFAGLAHHDMAEIGIWSIVQKFTGETFLKSQTGTTMRFHIGSNEAMRINSDSNLGIGLTNPSTKLEVIGDISASGVIEVGKNSDTQHILGKVALGKISGFPNLVSFSHLAKANINEYALLHTDDGETILNSSTNKSVFFGHNGTTKMILKAGNLGIGTTDPTEKLQIDGSLLVNTWSSTTGGTAGIFFRSGCASPNTACLYHNSIMPYDVGGRGDTSGLSINAFFGITFCTGSNTRSERFRIAENGDVGIGTTNPLEKLHVDGSLLVDTYEGGVGGTNGIFFRNDHIATSKKYNVSILTYAHADTTSADGLSINGFDGVSICTGSNTRSERFRIDTNGLVGIGLTNPTTKLEVIGDISCNSIQAHSSSEVSQIADMKFGNIFPTAVGIAHKDKYSTTDWGILFGSSGHLSLNASTGTWMKACINDVVGWNMRGTGTDIRVRIGTTTTIGDERLHVDGNIKATGKIVNDTFTTVADTSMYLKTGSSSGDITRMTIFGNTGRSPDDAGYVGIGIGTPASKLHVLGDAFVSSGDESTNASLFLATPHINGQGVKKTALIAEAIGSWSRSNLHICIDNTTDDTTFASIANSKIKIQTDGNVGIGTVAPISKLHVDNTAINLTTSAASGSNATGARVRFAAIDTTDFRAQLVLSSGFSDLVIASSWINGGHGSTLTFASYDPNNTTDYRKFVINQGNWGGGSRASFLDFGYSNTTQSNNPHAYITSTHTAFTIDGGNKRIGIGTMTPTETVDVNGVLLIRAHGLVGTQANKGLFFREGSTPSSFASSGNDYRYSLSIFPYDVQSIGYTNGLSINAFGGITFCTGSETRNEYLRITEGGLVGIGTTTPKTKLHVVGSGGSIAGNSEKRMFSYNQFLPNPGSTLTATVNGIGIFADESIFTGSWVGATNGIIGASDIRIKDNIVDISDGFALDTLRLLKPKQYTYKDTKRRGTEPVWGFIAQEVRETLPHATHKLTDTIPNIRELVDVSGDIITFNEFNTIDLDMSSTILSVYDKTDNNSNLTIAEIIDGSSVRIIEDMSGLIGDIDASGEIIDGNKLYVHGQEVDDFIYVKKDAIWTVATAALQEIDRQLQVEKTRNDSLETIVSSQATTISSQAAIISALDARLTALEN